MKKALAVSLSIALVLSLLSISVSATTSDGYDYGDINYDGAVDAKDALMLRKHLADFDDENYHRESADTNGDDDISLADLLLLRQYLADPSVKLGPDITAKITLFDGVNSVAEGDSTNVTFTTNSTYGTVITFSGNGTYYLSGTMTGRIIVKYPTKSDDDKITLVLNGVNITNSANCPIWVDKAEKTVITTIKKTENTITDLSATVTDAKKAAIYADDDLTINGNGTLNINANGKNGVYCENDLKINGGDINVTAGKNGLVGETSIQYKDGTSTIICNSDALKVTDEEKTDKGYIEITDGTIYASCGDDVLQATRLITVNGGIIYYKFTASDISTCHKTKVGTENADGTVAIQGEEQIADGSFVEWQS